MDVEERKNTILRNLQESLGVDKLTKRLIESKTVHVYWGTATTGRPHVGYFVAMQKISDFLNSGLKVTILFADLHAFLDNLKSTWQLLENRVKYYEHIIKSLLTALDVPLEQLHFVKGTEYQLTEKYTKDLLRLCACVSQRDALRAGAEVVKQVENPLLSGLLYPLLQALDEEHLKVDGQFGGLDQRKIFVLAEEQLPKLKFQKRFHLMNPMVPGLTGSKMSSSEEDSKIDLLDKSNAVNRKIDSASCSRDNLDDNGVLSFYRYVVLPIVSPRPVELNSMSYQNFDEIKTDFESGKLEADDLKGYLKDFLNGVLEKVQNQCLSADIQDIIDKAYPKRPELNGQADIQEVEDHLNRIEIHPCNEPIMGFEEFEVIDSPRFLEKHRGNHPLKVLYRISAKGRIHLGHFMALMFLKKLSLNGHKAIILISDLGAFLDNQKCPWNAMEARVDLYEKVLRQFLEVLSLDAEIRRSSMTEYNENYTLDMYKMASKVTRDASAIVHGSTLGTNLVPIYYALDVHYADVDVVLVGEDQKSFIDLSHKMCNSIGIPTQAALMMPTLQGMDGQKMSSTKPDFHLDPFDTPNQTKKKIGSSFCEPGNVQVNIALDLAKKIIFPMLPNGEPIIIQRKEEYGGDLTISDYATIHKLFSTEELHPSDLKPMVTSRINRIFEPIRSKQAEFNALLKSAFPKKK